MHELLIKRIYEDSDSTDGYRILVDRLWPRGESKVKADLDEWAKEIAPSTEVRKAFNHVPENMQSFRKQYIEELNNNPAAAEFLSLVKEKLKKGNVTLLYGAKDEVNNQAIVLKEWVTKKIDI